MKMMVTIALAFLLSAYSSQAAEVVTVGKFDLQEACNLRKKGLFLGATGYSLNIPKTMLFSPIFPMKTRKTNG